MLTACTTSHHVLRKAQGVMWCSSRLLVVGGAHVITLTYYININTNIMAVRLAKASDPAATSRIAFRGFSLSPWNAFYRPFASAYPQDVERSYLREQQEALGDFGMFSML
ncbi:hypothetical protein FPANT_12672 [Fusarium pseudoanthophilum]|uniref:Uncharacterized protein n=1 Tax=Fusarium pseudoanthophilum TaxID=48495 RepID=A0A8H5KIX7_9HYPO|nr:hypothetical protein FPANT_12672 [Fusarium pseudoanthophilum]